MTASTRTRRWARKSAAIAAAAGSLALASTTLGPTAAGAALVPPTHGDCPDTVVRSAELVRTTHGPGILVRGIAPSANVSLHLVPDEVVFIRQPEYWTYFVMGCNATGPVVKTAYSKVFPVPTGPVGSLGIQIGRSLINLPGATGAA